MTYKHKNKYKASFDFDNIKANHLIEVEYAPYYKITTKIDHGTIVDDILNISSGENKKVKWKPAEGYYVSKIIVDNAVTYEGNDYSKYPENYDFDNITADHDVIVETKKMTYKIETEVINGTITDNQLDIPYGENRVIKYAPKKGYKIANITIDGKEIEITDENSFECVFNDIRDNHTIKVVYKTVKIISSIRTQENESTHIVPKVNNVKTVDNVPKTGVSNNIEQYLLLVMGIISMVIITLIMINRSLQFRKYNK